MWKLIISDDQGQQTVVKLVRERYEVGRAEGNPIRFTERNISRTHAVLQQTENGYRIEDRGSYNGVFVNAVRVVGRHDLAHHDVVQIGDYRIEVIDETLATQEQSFRDFHTEPNGGSLPTAGRLPHRLVVLVGPRQGHGFALDGDRMLIGRGEECDIQLDHASVSRVHAEVRQLDDETFEIIDKGSANGLRINGHDRPRALLDGRDVVELGDVVLKYIPEGQVFRADREEGRRIAALGGAPPPPAYRMPQLGLKHALTAAAIGAVLVGLFALFLIPGSDANVESVDIDGEPTVAKAEKLLSAGDALGAHRMLSQVPLAEAHAHPESVRRIEAAWAQAALDSARSDGDPDHKKALLDAVARSPDVPTSTRKRALDALNQLNEDAVGLEELEQTNLAVHEEAVAPARTDSAKPVRAGVPSD